LHGKYFKIDINIYSEFFSQQGPPCAKGKCERRARHCHKCTRCGHVLKLIQKRLTRIVHAEIAEIDNLRQAQPLRGCIATVLTLLRNFNSLTHDISTLVTLSNALTHAKYLLVTASYVQGTLFNYLTHNLVLFGVYFSLMADKTLMLCVTELFI
jgi:hypothetical protein